MRAFLETFSLVVVVLYSPIVGAACVTVPIDAEEPLVTACETTDDYTFDVVGSRFSYAKAAYRERLRSEFAAWLTAAGVPTPDDGTVEFWLAVPETDPAATQARAVLRSESVNLVWYLSLHPDRWSLTNSSLGVLDDGPYPTSYGHRPAQLLIKARGPAEDARRTLLAELGARDPSPYAPNWSVYTTDSTREGEVMAAIKADPRSLALVERAEANHVIEWIAMRELAFTFAFSERAP